MAASFGARASTTMANKEYWKAMASTRPGVGCWANRCRQSHAVQVQDVQADPDYELNEIVRIGGYRTMLGVPLLREEIPVGVFVLTRAGSSPSPTSRSSLSQNFADQAVIAIENVRLFDEVEQRTRELSARSRNCAPHRTA